MKKTAIILLPTMLLFIGASCAAVSDPATVNPALKNSHAATVTQKTYTNTTLGVSFQYPDLWEVTSETENGVQFLRTDNQVIKHGTSAQDPDGSMFTLNLEKPESFDYILARQRSQGTYLTAEQEKKEYENYADSPFPQPTLASSKQADIDGKSGYVYSVQVKPTSEKLPITELTDYYDGLEYYIPIDENNVLTIRSVVGYGKEHDALMSEVLDVVSTIQLR